MRDDDFNPFDPKNSWMPVPPEGPNRLRRLLEQLEEDSNKLTEHPIYKEGYEDGYKTAQFEARCVVRALTKLYEDTSDSE